MDPSDSFQLICNIAMLNSHFYNREAFIVWAKNFITKIPALSSVVIFFIFNFLIF